MMKELFVIIPCGAGKVWDNNPGSGPCLAKDAYTGSPFKVNRKCAEKFAERWVILSAKSGFIDPDFIISGDYNVTFKELRTEPVSPIVLKDQIIRMGLDEFSEIIGFGGVESRVGSKPLILHSISRYNSRLRIVVLELASRWVWLKKRLNLENFYLWIYQIIIWWYNSDLIFLSVHLKF